MRAVHLCVMFGLLSASAQANDSFNSELSHFAGGAAMGAGFTAVADHYGYREHRGWIGFGISTGIGVVGSWRRETATSLPWTRASMRWERRLAPLPPIAGSWPP